MNMQSPLVDSISLARHARGSMDDMEAILNQGQKGKRVPRVSTCFHGGDRRIPQRTPIRILGKAETTNQIMFLYLFNVLLIYSLRGG